VWDETVVLPPSEIEEAAVFARRSGTRWFVGALNAAAQRTIAVDPGSFAGRRSFTATIVRDRLDDPGAMEVEDRALKPGEPLEIPVRRAGGFVVRLTPR
jgi:alpha-glucosidase